MNARLKAEEEAKFRNYAKNISNYKLKAASFDAHHLDQFIMEDQIKQYETYEKFNTIHVIDNKEHVSAKNTDDIEMIKEEIDQQEPNIAYFKPRTEYSKTRKELGVSNPSMNAELTSIRPSHYFISIPRSSVSYKKSEVVNNDSVLMYKKKNNFIINNQLNKLQDEFTKYDNKLKSWKQNAIPVVSSERLKDARDLTKTIREYQNLKTTIMFYNRKAKFSNNRWREEIGKVFDTRKPDENYGNRISQRNIAFHKFILKNQANINRSATIDANWTRKRRCKSKSLVDTFARIQKRKIDKTQILTLRDSLFCFKKCNMSHTKPREFNIVSGTVNYLK